MDFKKYINEIPDFPKSGVSFKDISPLLKSTWLPYAIHNMMGLVEHPNYWVGIDSRGFIFASAIAASNGGGFIMCRKKGKLPPPVVSQTYSLEYGEDTLEIQPGTGKVVIVDDVYATGGTMNAVEELCKKAGYEVIDRLVLIDLKYLHEPNDVKSLIQYE
jgi:adenine phosphoribosyltransferase